jgi:ankyrin repeat protein
LKADPSLLNEQDEEGYTPLHLSVIAGNAAIVKFLISQGSILQHFISAENFSE